MGTFKLIFILVLTLFSPWISAETTDEAAIRKVITPRLGADVKIDSVTKTPYSGLYEVRVGKDLMYVDEEAKYLFVGRILDTKTFQDYTKSRVQELNKVNFSDLPLVSAMKVVKGNGKRVLAVFEDPNCGYCRKFEKVLREMDNVTVYTFMYNILSADSLTKAKNIWCSNDKVKAWDDWMINKKLSSAPANEACSFPHEQVIDFGKKWKIKGTPTVIFADGTSIPGTADAKALEAKLATLN